MTCERHTSILIYRRRLRDFFRKSYWLACVRCQVEQGPFTYSDMMAALDDEIDAVPYGAPELQLPPPLDTRFDDDDDNPGGPITFYCADAYREKNES